MSGVIQFSKENKQPMRFNRQLMEAYVDGRHSGLIDAMNMAYHLYVEWADNDDDTPFEEILEDVIGDLIAADDFEYEEDEE